jgi:hypothetical protein
VASGRTMKGGFRDRRVRRISTVAMLILTLAVGGCKGSARAGSPLPAPSGGQSYAAFCGGATGCPGGGVPTALRRPIHLPHVAAGSQCPVSAPGHKVRRGSGAAIGPGPIYAVSLGPFARTAVLPFVLPSRAGLFGGSAWGGQKVLWLGTPSYHGPVLIRGRNLTGRSALGFGAGKTPKAEIDVPPGPAGGVGLNADGWRLWSGYARLRSPGCYGFQIDGTTFSELIIFRACLSSNPVRQTGRCEQH